MNNQNNLPKQFNSWLEFMSMAAKADRDFFRRSPNYPIGYMTDHDEPFFRTTAGEIRIRALCELLIFLPRNKKSVNAMLIELWNTDVDVTGLDLFKFLQDLLSIYPENESIPIADF